MDPIQFNINCGLKEANYYQGKDNLAKEESTIHAYNEEWFQEGNTKQLKLLGEAYSCQNQLDKEEKETEAVVITSKNKKEIQHGFKLVQIKLDQLQTKIKGDNCACYKIFFSCG